MSSGEKVFYGLIILVLLLGIGFLGAYGLAALTGWSLWVTIPVFVAVNATANVAAKSLLK